MSEEQKEKLRKYHAGLHLSEETKKKLSEATKGKGCVKIQCVETKMEYSSIREASELTGIKSGTISYSLRSGGTGGGYHWIYFEEYVKIDSIEEYLSEINKKNHRPHKRRVLCVETQEIFESVTQAANIKKLSLYSIAECCRNKKENNYTCGGYHWRYIDE